VVCFAKSHIPIKEEQKKEGGNTGKERGIEISQMGGGVQTKIRMGEGLQKRPITA